MKPTVRPHATGGQDLSPPTRRVIDVIELLAGVVKQPLTLAQICRDLQISRSTGHAILATLCACDWISRDPLSGTYSLASGFPQPRQASAPIADELRRPLQQLCSTLGMAACLSELRSGHIAVIESAAPTAMQAQVHAGQSLPFVAPFGREFVAWAPAWVRQEWLDAAGPVNDVYRTRIPKVLKEIRRRGYGIERLSDPLLKVYAALLAVEDGRGPDPVAARLAGAVADLTIVDFLPGELTLIEQSPLATISAPIFGQNGEVAMTVSAQPYRRLTREQVSHAGGHLLEFAQHAGLLITQHETSIGDR